MPKIGDEAFTRAEDFNELTETFSRDKAFFEVYGIKFFRIVL